ncbi:MAG TPA: phosphoribosyl-AMP cyclohydrolase [Thermoanaerobaculia bacterium]|nr:phosphoribosyl-AMP cyclohydrolase [Thermoanaerobaculia bacterium]
MELDFAKFEGLLPAVVQEAGSGRVLMVGFMDEAAFAETVASGEVTFFSRSRGALWKKGESSGHRLLVRTIRTDCDRDTLLVEAAALGPGVCHEGYASCFYRELKDGAWVEREPRAFDPAAVYGGGR